MPAQRQRAAQQPAEPQPPEPLQILSIYEAIARAKADCSPVGKGDYNEQQRFNFRGIDSVLNGVARALDRYGVIWIPEVTEIEKTSYQSKNGSNMLHVLVHVTYHVSGADGSELKHPPKVVGESADSGDKAVSKAMSVAFRTALIQVLNLPTGDPDPDTESHERAPQSAGEAFAMASPAPPRGQRPGNGQRPAGGNGQHSNGHTNGNGQQPGNGQPRPQRMAAQQPLDPEDPWVAAVEEISTQDEAQARWKEVKGLFKENQLDADRANRILYAIQCRADVLAGRTEPAPPVPGPAQGSPSGSDTAAGDDLEWINDCLVRIANAQAVATLDGLKGWIGQAFAQRRITDDVVKDLNERLGQRRRELQGAAQ